MSKRVRNACRDSLVVVGRIRNDARGNVAITFGLFIMVIFGLVGGALDYGRWLTTRSQQQNAMDSAALAAARVAQLTGSDEAAVLAAANSYYGQMKSSGLVTDDTLFKLVDQGKAVEGTSNGKVFTPFLAVLGIGHMPVKVKVKALLASGGTSDMRVEVSMMLDVTGSMEGTKIDDLKLAAKDLVNIVVDENDPRFSRIGIAPFSENVNVGRDLFDKVTGQVAPGTGTERTCVRERQTSDRYTDEAPGAGNFFDAGPSSGTCKPQSLIVPLTGVKTTLIDAIDGLSTNGATAGHLGTAWAWYLLSPKWSTVWPTDAQAGPYHDTKIRKYAVLMTDGEYNKNYSGDSATTQARELCTNMKAAGITVFTVGFQMTAGTSSYTTLQQCATSTRHFYDSATGESLRQAFRDIALQIATLRLTN